MLSSLFNSIFSTTTTTSAIFALPQFIGALAVALILGLFMAAVYKKQNATSQSFSITLALLPAVVAVVIMMVNGNIGAGVAVAGAFSLVRFRSVPGTAKEISMIFLSMACGLMCGMGYLGYAILFSVILIAAMLVLTAVGFGSNRGSEEKVLRITIPESLNYSEVFDDIFEQYTSSCNMISVKTTNMGSMFKLSYNVILKDSKMEKEFIDALRVKNGNLEIAMARQESLGNEL
ncbi:MAG: DUF4956 domain-containing protein [Lachnospiraceae bacterium]|nr:DUF4956 domain-containing protein [Lachnospiraceae bacterium]